jgi:putative cardiolipin synthase
MILGGCANLPPRPTTATEQLALPIASDTALDEAIAPLAAAHPGQTGFHLVLDGVEAFALRGLSARKAGRSLDVQYFIWHDDLTGRLLARELLAAADRGVRVRMLLDDLDARQNNFALAALDAHPMIDVRLFHPFASRKGGAVKMFEFLGNMDRMNHRMHNKNWIADNRVAISGGP